MDLSKFHYEGWKYGLRAVFKDLEVLSNDIQSLSFWSSLLVPSYFLLDYIRSEMGSNLVWFEVKDKFGWLKITPDHIDIIGQWNWKNL